MLRDVVQRFLHDPIHVYGGGPIDRDWRALALVRHAQTGLALHRRKIPVDGAFEAGLFEDRRVKRLRQAAHVGEHVLCDLGNFTQIGFQRRALRRVVSCSFQHRSHCRQHLTELVVQLAGDVPQRRLTSRDQFLRQLVALL